MPIETLYVYQPTDNPDWSLNEGTMYNTSGTSTMGSFTTVDVLDDDGLLSDSLSGINGTTVDSSQQVIDGTSTKVQGFFHLDIYNATTGEFGKAFLLTTGSPNNNSNALGWVFTTPVSPGDTINWLPTVNGEPNDEDWFAWGEVAYADLEGPPPALDYTVEGTAGDDVIDAAYTGDPEGDMVDNSDALDGSQDDLIEAYGGNDSVTAGAGDDEIYGGSGDDTIDAGAGNDTVFGGSGDDVIDGGTGDDTLLGEDGDDTFKLSDNFGNDTITGGETGETVGDTLDLSGLTTGVTVDLTSTDPEAGTVSDGVSTANFAEIETLVLGGGRDTIVLADGSGADAVNAFDMTDSGDGTTNDQLDVSSLTSDGGTTPVNTSDVTVTDTNGDGTGDAILTFPGGESITLVGVTPSQVDTPQELASIGIPLGLDYTVEGTAGDDVIDAAYTGDPEGDMVDNSDAMDGSQDDLIEAYGGNDSVTAGAGDDEIYGGSGNDTIDGGAGNDSVDGGEGNDVIFGGDGNDVIHGGSGSASLADGSFEGFTPTTTSQAGELPDWYQWNTGSADLNDDSGYEVPWLNGTATDGSNYVSFGRIGSNREGISQDLDVPIAANSTATITFDAAAFAWSGSSYSAQTTVELAIWGNPDSGQVGTDGNNPSPGAVLLGTVTIDTTTMTAYSVDITPTFDMETISFSVGTESFSYMIALDAVEISSAEQGDDTLTGGDGDDTFIYEPGDGADVITDFGTGNTGPIDDGDQTNNDFVDLSGFYNATSLADVNANGGDFDHELGMLRADAADGTIDGVIDGVDYSAQIGDIDLTIENGGTAVTGTDLTFDNTNVVCFTRGTLIRTANGEVPVQNLEVGDLIETKDDGYRPLRWIGSRELSKVALKRRANLRPIRIKAGALNGMLPERDLLVSPQHRVLVTSAIAARMFGQSEVLVAAKHLTQLPGISVADDVDEVEYWHFMFDDHQVVYAEGAETESLYAGEQTLQTVSPVALREIYALFPELEAGQVPTAARPLVKGRQGRRLAERHLRNKRLLTQPQKRKAAGQTPVERSAR